MSFTDWSLFPSLITRLWFSSDTLSIKGEISPVAFNCSKDLVFHRE